MGCDIHLHTEVKINGVWHHYSCPSIPRNYNLFAKMAGVRSGLKPIAEPKGLPEDATALTLYDFERWGSDGHTPSWLNAEEILELMDWTHENLDRPENWRGWECDVVGYLFGGTWGGFTKYPDDRPEGLEDIRWIFWFDN